MFTPTPTEYRELAKSGQAVPISHEMLADIETPLGAYWKLVQGESHSFLLESVSGGEQVARFSIIGVRPKSVFRAKSGEITIQGRDITTNEPYPESGDPLEVLRRLLPKTEQSPDPSHPTFVGGAVGLISYDYVRTIENLPDSNPDELGVDDVAMMVTESVVLFDHAKNVITITVLADGSAEGYTRAVAEIERLKERLKHPLPPLPDGSFPVHDVHQNISQEEFQDSVVKVKNYIVEGDCFQVVPSVRLATKVDAHPVTVYRALRSLNPSPFMYLLRFDDLDVVGASPELLVGLKSRQARVRPIAGTRPRGASSQEDFWLAEELLADEKERAEHIMLVDLGRNDLGRVCNFGTVKVQDMMVVEKYSHVMHIVSDVIGQLNDEFDGIDLVRATFPAGTLSGAPKIRAMEIIDEVEKSRRGLYGGSVGYFSANGDIDLAIAIRTILLKDGIGYVQAGGGVVFDSDPQLEYQEARNKAKAALRAIEIAQKSL